MSSTLAALKPEVDNADAFLITGEGTEVVAPGVWILRGQGNSIVFELDAGLVIVDSGPGGRVTAGMIKALREVSNAPVHAIGFSHGHLGYNSGLPQWLEHARARGGYAPRTIAHANLPRRVARGTAVDPVGNRRLHCRLVLRRTIARDVYRSENGWWDRNPTSLHPASIEDASDAITDKQAILDHARKLASEGKTQLALHVVDVLATLSSAGPEIEEARRLKAAWVRERATELQSYISKSIYHAAAQMMDTGQPARFGIA